MRCIYHSSAPRIWSARNTIGQNSHFTAPVTGHLTTVTISESTRNLYHTATHLVAAEAPARGTCSACSVAGGTLPRPPSRGGRSIGTRETHHPGRGIRLGAARPPDDGQYPQDGQYPHDGMPDTSSRPGGRLAPTHNVLANQPHSHRADPRQRRPKLAEPVGQRLQSSASTSPANASAHDLTGIAQVTVWAR